MEYVFMAGTVLFLILVIFIKGWYDYRKNMRLFREKLKTGYGTKLNKEYKEEKYQSIVKYYQKHPGENTIDDITWNDLNMDAVFEQINYTHSFAGETYLYYLLRQPEWNETKLNNREQKIQYFMEHEKDRIALQFLFHQMGYVSKFSLYDYLDYLDELEEKSNIKHYFAILLLILGIVAIFFNTTLGIISIIAILIYNNLTYFKTQKEIDPYIVSFAYIFRMMDSSHEIVSKKLPVIEEECKEIENASRALHRFKKGSYILMSSGRMNGGGNPIELLLDCCRMALHTDLIQFNKMLHEVKGHYHDIDCMITALGEIDACIAIGEYRTYKKEYCLPDFHTVKKIEAAELYHPLIDQPVKNQLSLAESMLITGSNASGKSTFLKTIAVNIILAQSIHTCFAKYLQLPFMRVISSMSLHDSILSGESYYMVEIKAIKRILDMGKSEGPLVCCFVDEVLRGTNTVERIAASTQILKSLDHSNCLCIAATHDIELTYLLEKQFHNYHFQENINEEDISFPYLLMEGRATSRNAIKLLSIMGYQDSIIHNAEKMAEHFMTSSKWETIE